MKRVIAIGIVSLIVIGGFMDIMGLRSNYAMAHSGDIIVVEAGTPPTIDGTISPGEWLPSENLVYFSGPGGHWVNLWFKHSDTDLYIGVRIDDGTFNTGDKFSMQIDVNHDGGTAPQTDDIRIYCQRDPAGLFGEDVGTGTGWASATASGWFAVLTTAANNWEIEFSVSYAKLGIVAGVNKTVGIQFGVWDFGVQWYYWPSGSNMSNPNTWVDLCSSVNFVPENSKIFVLSFAIITLFIVFRKARRKSNHHTQAFLKESQCANYCGIWTECRKMPQ
jgi:hypothetical protein